MDLGIKGKSALVTGGSRGIGRETVRRFLEEGARVFTCARNEEALAETCAGLADETGGEVHYAVADTSNDCRTRAFGREKHGKNWGVSTFS